MVRLNLRDHGDTHHLNEGIFHSCRLPEAVGAVAAVAPQLAAPPSLVGFSLGGNFMLRVAASDDPRVPALARVIAISPVLHPDSAMLALERGLRCIRTTREQWRRSMRRKGCCGRVVIRVSSAGSLRHDVGEDRAAHELPPR